jgi:hypothetical protein
MSARLSMCIALNFVQTWFHEIYRPVGGRRARGSIAMNCRLLEQGIWEVYDVQVFRCKLHEP